MGLRYTTKHDTLVDPDTYAPSNETLVHDPNEPWRTRIDDHLKHRIRLGGHITYYDRNGVHVIEDKNGVRPITEDYVTPDQPDSAELKIRELAWMNRIHATRDEWDDYADAITRLADDEVEFDEVQELIVALRKAKIVNGIELTKLHARYLEERDA